MQVHLQEEEQEIKCSLKERDREGITIQYNITDEWSTDYLELVADRWCLFEDQTLTLLNLLLDNPDPCSEIT